MLSAKSLQVRLTALSFATNNTPSSAGMGDLEGIALCTVDIALFSSWHGHCRIIGKNPRFVLYLFCTLCSRHRHHKDYGFVEKPHNERRNRHFLSSLPAGNLWKSYGKVYVIPQPCFLSIGSMENHHEKLRYKLRKRLWFSFKTRESAQ